MKVWVSKDEDFYILHATKPEPIVYDDKLFECEKDRDQAYICGKYMRRLFKDSKKKLPRKGELLECEVIIK